MEKNRVLLSMLLIGPFLSRKKHYRLNLRVIWYPWIAQQENKGCMQALVPVKPHVFFINVGITQRMM